MRGLSDTENQEVDRSISDVLKDFIVSLANGHVRSRITEFLCLFRYKAIKSAEEAVLKVG